MTLLLCAAPMMATPMVLEDFQDGADGWRYLSDQVMGGVSEGQAALGREGDMAFASLTGDVSTANNGGFVQMRRDLPDGLETNSTKLNLTVRGNGEVYYIHLRTIDSRRPWQYFAATFPTTADWTNVTINWADFAPNGRDFDGSLNPQDIRSIGIVAYGKDHAADVSVSAISVD